MAKSSPRGASKSQSADSSNWAPLLALGFVLGVVSTLGLQYLMSSNAARMAGEPGEVANEPEGQERDFEFYTLLNDMQVQVPESDLALAEDDNIIYWLQAGSFRSAEDAESMRVQLILKNMDTEIRPVSNDGVLWHRVVVGPFETRTLMNGAKQTLINDGLQPMTLRQELP